ncbi:MAG: glycosyltransferase [Chitinophagaceae bacterium]|nr:glycosyltransferase [Chitinophagaceae bacterium]
MMTVFWISALLLFHAYFGYAITAWLAARRSPASRKPQEATDILPRVAFIIPACDEAGVIQAKCRNTLALDYPSDLLDIIVVSDGSADKTPELAAQCPGVRVLHQPARMGKAAAINRAVGQADLAEILVFSDANTLLSGDALRLMMRHYADPEVGGVSGEKRVSSKPGHPVHAEGIYWRYESRMKQLDAGFYSLVAAAGELFSIRRSHWEPIPEDTILDDLHLTLTVCRRRGLSDPVSLQVALVAVRAFPALVHLWLPQDPSLGLRTGMPCTPPAVECVYTRFDRNTFTDLFGGHRRPAQRLHHRCHWMGAESPPTTVVPDHTDMFLFCLHASGHVRRFLSLRVGQAVCPLAEGFQAMKHQGGIADSTRTTYIYGSSDFR